MRNGVAIQTSNYDWDNVFLRAITHILGDFAAKAKKTKKNLKPT